MAKKISEMENYAEFAKVCRYEKAEEEYPGWVGDERYIVYSHFQREEIETLFPEIMKAISPYIVMDTVMRKAVYTYNNIEQKHSKRQWNMDCLDSLINTIDNSKDLEEEFDKKEAANQQMEILKKILTEKQYVRLFLHLGYGYTLEDIANRDGTTVQAVGACVKTAQEKLNKYLSKRGKKKAID